MKLSRKWLLLLCGVIMTALVLPMSIAASPDQPADGQDAAVSTDQAAQPRIFTTDDGVMQLTLPDDSWKQINDEGSWLALSSGTDHITVDHLSNGDPLPAVVIADDQNAEVYQVFYSTKDEVFVATGTVEDAACMDEVCEIIESFKVLKFGTLQAKQPEQPKFDLRPIGQNMYCIADDGVHVRSGCSTDDAIIGGVNYGDQVYVNGMVTKDGQDYGWLQIQYGNDVGYVWGEFFDVNQPAPPQPDPVVTDTSMFLYAPAGGNIDLFQWTDGIWRSYDGSIVYTDDGNGLWTASDGSIYYSDPFNPNMDPCVTDDELTVYSADDEPVTLFVYTDGSWRDGMNDVYYPNGDGTITGPHGFPFYETEEDIPDQPGPPLLYSTEDGGDTDEGDEGDEGDDGDVTLGLSAAPAE